MRDAEDASLSILVRGDLDDGVDMDESTSHPASNCSLERTKPAAVAPGIGDGVAAMSAAGADMMDAIEGVTERRREQR